MVGLLIVGLLAGFGVVGFGVAKKVRRPPSEIALALHRLGIQLRTSTTAKYTLGKLSYVPQEKYQRCAYCRTRRYDLTIFTRKSVPQGAIDQGLGFHRHLGGFCLRCGYVETSAAVHDTDVFALVHAAQLVDGKEEIALLQQRVIHLKKAMATTEDQLRKLNVSPPSSSKQEGPYR